MGVDIKIIIFIFQHKCSKRKSLSAGKSVQMLQNRQYPPPHTSCGGVQHGVMVGRYRYDRFSTTNVVKMQVFTFSQKLSGTRLKSCVLGIAPRIGGWGPPKMTLAETKDVVSMSGEQPCPRVKIDNTLGSAEPPRVGQLNCGAGNS